MDRTTFENDLARLGLSALADESDGTRFALMDSFHRARLNLLLRSYNPDLSDKCLRSIDAIDDAYGWIADIDAPDLRNGCYLDPVLPEDYELIYRVASDPARSHRWRFRGSTPRPTDLADHLHQGTLCHYLVRGPGDRTPQGYLALYNNNPTDGYASFAFQRLGHGRSTAMYEGVYKFFDHCFATFNLRKIYVEVPGFNLPQFASILDQVFTVEAVLPERDFFDGAYWPTTIASLSRHRWAELHELWAPFVA